jgi:pyridinium-3,5-biscarboxylic acid mononucleotide synthase
MGGAGESLREGSGLVKVWTDSASAHAIMTSPLRIPVDNKRLRHLLKALQERKVSVEQALRQLKFLPFEDLGFAKVDHHRQLRRGFPEVVFGHGKSAEQIASIMQSLAKSKTPILVTRASPENYRIVRRAHPRARYHPQARAITLTPTGWRSPNHPGIAVLAAGTSDLPAAEEAALTAEVMGHRVERVYDVGVAGLHRLLSHRDVIVSATVLVVAAGMEGALPSVVAGLVDAPVIGLPTSVGYGAGSGGIAALLSMLNSCAGGVLVVNIDNGFGAGLAAGMINLSSLQRKEKAYPPRPGTRSRAKLT